MLYVLTFMLLTVGGIILEEGNITAASCQAAQQMIEQELRSYQRISIESCLEKT